ncbi:MAG: hypothetical protein RMJ44_08730 [Cytophagales bacterium]|nr:hypothetical protein [Bernardetiaceae bacterium]MDW8211158.1 hypothetical protein [Cytophagales bacterium]
MRKTNVLSLLGILLICTACPYQSAVPVDEPNQPVKEEWLGKWKTDVNAKDFYEVTKLGDNIYQIVEHTYKVEGAIERKTYIAHTSAVGDMTFLNVKMTRQGASVVPNSDFLIFKIKSAEGKKITLLPVTENVREKFDNSAELRNFILENDKLSFFYEKETVYTKVD